MKEYDKEKLHEYAKELFALCLEKGFHFDAIISNNSIYVESWGHTYICEQMFDYRLLGTTPIWELIEKVKQL